MTDHGLGAERAQALHLPATAELLPAAVHRGERLVQRDLERRELAVDVLVDLLPHGLGVVLRLRAQPARLDLGLLEDGSLGDELEALGVRLGDDPVRLDVAVLHDLVPAGQQLLGEVDLGGQQGPELVQQGEDLGAVDDARGGHRHGAGRLHQCGDLVELLVDVHGLLLS